MLWEYELVTSQESSLSVCFKKPKDTISFLEMFSKTQSEMLSVIYINNVHNTINRAKKLKQLECLIIDKVTIL